MLFHRAFAFFSWVFLGLALNTQLTAAQYQHPDRKFGFSFDETNWEIVKNPDPATAGQDVDKKMASLTLVTVQRKQADNKYRARFSVVIDNSKKFPGTPEQQFTAYQKHAVGFMKGQRFHVLSTTPLKLPNVKEPAFEIQANQRDFGLRFRQVLFARAGEFYLLTVAARTDSFPAHQKELDGFFDGFEFLP